MIRLLLCSLVLLLFTNAGNIGSERSISADNDHTQIDGTFFHPRNETTDQTSLAAALNPDGTIKSGWEGTFNPDGYQMSYGANGEPVFDPISPLGVGDDKWKSMPDFGGLNGKVRVIVVNGTNLYVGGDFTNAGGNENADYIAMWDGSAWNSLGTGMNAWVYAIVISGTDVYVGGDFSNAGGAPNTSRIAVWNGSSWSSVGGGLNSSVMAIAMNGTDLYVGGFFTDAGGDVFADHIAVWDGSTWSSVGTGLDGIVYSIAVSGTDLYVGGSFTDAGGIPTADYLAIWNGFNWVDSGAGLNFYVNEIAVSGSNVYVGGLFYNASVPNVEGIIVWNGSSWNSLGNFKGSVEAVTVVGSNVYVGGFFENAGGVANADRIAVWNGSWNALGTGTSNEVYAIAVDGSNVYAGGSFLDAGGTPNTQSISVWNGAKWGSLGVGVNSYVSAIVVSGSKVYVGGSFTDAGGNSNADGIAVWNGTAWEALGTGTGPTSYVNAIAVSGTNVYVGGGFSDVGGNVNADGIAVWNGTSWGALGTGIDVYVNAIAVSGSNVYVGGAIYDAGGNPNADNIAVWNGTSWNALGTGLNASVQALAVSGSNVYAGGFFTDAGGIANADGIAVWNGTNWNALGNGLSGFGVFTIAISGSKIYAGGDFSFAGGTVDGANIAIWDGTTWKALGTGLNDAVNAIAVSGLNVYAAGRFTNAGGNANGDYIAVWNGSSWKSLGTGVNDMAFSLALSESNAFVGGHLQGTGDNSISAKGIIQRNGVFPAVIIDNPTVVSPTDITLKGTIKPGDLTGTYRFEWGTASGNPNNYSTNQPLSGTALRNVSNNVSWTTPNSTLYFRIRVDNDEGTFYSEEKSYTFPSEIEIKQGSTIILSNDNYDFGSFNYQVSSIDIDFTINNLGLANLSLTGSSGNYITKSGTHAADFVIQQAAVVSPIPSGTSRIFKVKFTPQGIGARTAKLTINSNDPNEPAYSINLKGTGTKINQTITFAALPIKAKGDAPITLTATSSSGLPVTFTSSNLSVATVSGTQLTFVGAGSATIKANQTGNTNYNAAPEVGQNLIVYETEPTAAATNLQFTNITSSSLTVSFTAASGAPQNYLVLRRAGSPTSGIPADGTGYIVNAAIGSSVVAYVGSATSFGDVGLTQTTTYHYTVFSFNGTDGTANYRTSDPLTGAQATAAAEAGQIKITEPLVFDDELTKAETAATINAQVTDGTVSKTVQLFYKAITSEGGYTSTSMSNTVGSNTFTNTIPATALDVLGVEFYIQATDATGQDKSDTYYIYQAFTAQEAVAIPSIVRSGGTEKTYQIISIPFSLGSDDNIADIFEDELGGYDKTKWRLVRYQNEKNTDYKAGISKIELGKSYWFNSLEKVTIKPPAGTAPHFNQENPFRLQLEKGWNQIANPYPFAIDWDDVLDANDPTSDIVNYQIYSPEGAEPFPTFNSMNPYEGGFVFAKNAIPLELPVILKNTAGGRKASTKLPNNIDGDTWLIPIRIAQGNQINSSVGVGMHPQAAITEMDAYDDATLPRFFQYLEGNFYHPEYFWPKFSKDVVPTTEEYEWNLKLESSTEGNFILQWDRAAIAAAQSALFLFDADNGVLADMRKQSSMELAATNTKELKIIYSHKGEYSPSITFLGKPWPNPGNKQINLPLFLSDVQTDYMVETEIFDLRGTAVKTLPLQNYSPGFHTLEWDATDHLSNLIADGVYIVKMKVNGKFLPQFQKVVIQRNR